VAEAQARWAARAFPDYAFEIRRSCFRAPVTQWARVEVAAGHVDRVVLLESNAEVLVAELSLFPTVEDVFSSILRASDAGWVEDVRVEFDRNLGFPTHVALVAKPEILDGGSSSFLRNAGPIP
jgi:hypothetical protein